MCFVHTHKLTHGSPVHAKDFKAVDVEDGDDRGGRGTRKVSGLHSLVDAGHNQLEQTLIDCLESATWTTCSYAHTRGGTNSLFLTNY